MNTENLKYSKDHIWVSMQDDIATIGITDYAQSELSDIVYIDITELDEELEVGDIFGSIEAVKTVSDLFMPINGKIIEFNSELTDKPELVNNEPYKKGWIAKIVPAQNANLNTLLNEESYKEFIAE
ncbi:MAG: glycine cleavage system protein GcvH [Flavobacteriales bacterium]|nr:glycine cleavage system protein GcvH [Flavobacteriales bacterium]